MARPLPSAPSAEAAALGCVLIDETALEALRGRLSPDDFYLPGNRLIYETMLELRRQGVAIEPIALLEALHKQGRLREAGGVHGINQLTEGLPQVDDVEPYLQLIADAAARRAYIRVSLHMQNLAHSAATVDELRSEVESKVLEVGNDETGSELESVDDVVEAAGGVAAMLRKDKGRSTGFRELDDKLGGLRNGHLVVIMARPSMGKTSLLLRLALNVAKQADGAVALFSLEMDRQSLVARMACAEADISQHEFREGSTAGAERRLAEAEAAIRRLPIYIDQPRGSMADIASKCRRLKVAKGLRLVGIDYWQLMSEKGHDNRVAELSSISRQAKLLAMELDVPVVLLSQLNRDCEKRADKRPMLSDLRESGSGEQDADEVIGIYRDVVYHAESAEPTLVELLLRKHRNGPTGVVRLAFVERVSDFRSLSYRYAEEDASWHDQYEH